MVIDCEEDSCGGNVTGGGNESRGIDPVPKLLCLAFSRSLGKKLDFIKKSHKKDGNPQITTVAPLIQ